MRRHKAHTWLAALTAGGALAACEPPQTPGERSGPPHARVAEVAITSDTNGDGALSPGETGRLRVQVQNDGGVRLDDVELLVVVASPHVTFLGPPALACGSLHPGSDDHCGDSWDYPQLRAATTAPAGPVPITLRLVTPDGLLVTEEHTLTVTPNPAAPSVTQVKVASDSNGDGALNPGETARLVITLTNQGTARMMEASLRVSAAPGAVSMTPDTELDCGTLDPGESAACGDSWDYPKVTVAESAAPGTSQTFTAVATDALGMSWPLTFTVPIAATAAKPALEALDVLSDTDGDGKLSPGEHARLRPTLRNTGTSRLVDARLTLESQADTVVVSGAEQDCGDVNPGQEVICGDSWDYPTVDAAQGAKADTAAPVLIHVEDAQGAAWTLSTQLPVVQTAAIPTLHELAVVQDETGDGALSPGEKGRLRVTLRNTGTSKLVEAEIEIASDAEWLEVTSQPTAECGTLSAGATEQCGDSWNLTQVQATADAPVGAAPVTVRVTDSLGNTWTLAGEIEIGP